MERDTTNEWSFNHSSRPQGPRASVSLPCIRRCRRIGDRLALTALGGFLFRELAQAFFFLFSFLFQISLTFFKRVIRFGQNNIPERQQGRMKPYIMEMPVPAPAGEQTMSPQAETGTWKINQ